MRNLPLPKSRTSATLLNHFWIEKKKNVPKYSMRALARDLKSSQSYVSEILSGKKRLPPERLTQWTQTLGLDSLSIESLKNALFKENYDQEMEDRKDFSDWNLKNSDEVFLSHWYHSVILELIDSKKWGWDAQSISSKIGISKGETEQALQKLQILGYLKHENGFYKKTQKKIRLATSRSLPTVRRFHKQMIERAVQNLFSQTSQESFEKRLISGITFSANPKNIKLAKTKLSQAIHEVAEILMEGECTEVYQLNVQFFNHLKN